MKRSANTSALFPAPTTVRLGTAAAMTVALGLSAAITVATADALRNIPRAETYGAADVLPSGTALAVMSLGYRAVAADYFWLRALSHFGDKRQHLYRYPSLAPLLHRVVALDPNHARAYRLAGRSLTLADQPFWEAIQLLQQGLVARPDDWFIPFYLGFIYFDNLRDFDRAAIYVTLAAEHDDAPSYIHSLATSLTRRTGSVATTLAFFDAVLQQDLDPKLRAIYEERRNEVLERLTSAPTSTEDSR